MAGKNHDEARRESNPLFNDRKLKLGTFCTNLDYGCAMSTIAGLWLIHDAHSGTELLVAGVLLGIGVTGTGISALVGTVGRAASPEKRTSAIASIGMAAGTPILVLARKDFPPKDLKEFAAYVKANEAKMNAAHAGVGSVSHVTGLLVNHVMGVKPTLIPFQGTGPAMNALVGGQVDYMTDQIVNAVPQVVGGTIKAYAIGTSERNPSLPNVPTAIEQGFKGFDIATMIGVQLSAGASSALVAKIQGEFAKAMREPDMAERFLALGMEMRENGTAHYTQYMKDDIALYAQAIKDAGGRFN